MAEGTVYISPGTITNSHIAAGANVAADKLQHQYAPTYGQPLSAATTETRVLHVVKGAVGTLVAFRAGSVAIAVGAATVTIDLKKNGTSMLTAIITLDTANVAYTLEEAALTTTDLAAGDVLTIVIVATAGGGTLPTGVFVEAVLRENA